MKHVSDLKIETSPEQTMKFRESIFINRIILSPDGHIPLKTSRSYLHVYALKAQGSTAKVPILSIILVLFD